MDIQCYACKSEYILYIIQQQKVFKKFKQECVVRTIRLVNAKNKIGQYALNGAKINCAAFSKKVANEEYDEDSPKERHEYFITGDTHNNVRFYQFSGEQELNCFNNNANSTVQAEVSAVATSWEERSVFSGSNRGIINVWDIMSSKNTPSCTLKGHATSVNCFGLFPEQENRIASGSYDTHIKLWDVREKNNIGMLKHHTKQINSIDISPDCHYLISGSQDCTTKLWDMRYPEKVVCTYSEHSAPVLKVRFNPQDCMFLSCSTDRTAKYFRCEHNHYDFISSTELVSMPITAIDFNPQGTRVCTAGNDILKIWNMNKNGILLETIDSAWKGVQDVLWCEKGIKGISSHGGYLSVWFCYLDARKNQQPQIKQIEPKLPRIFKNPSIKKQSVVINKNNSQKMFVKDTQELNEKEAERNKQLLQAMNDVNMAVALINNIDQNKQNREKQLKKQQQKAEKARKQQQKRLLEEEKKQKLRIKKQKQREEKQRKQRQRRQRIERQKEQEEQLKQQRLQAMAKERSQRQRILEERLHDTFEKNNNRNLEITLQPDVLEHSSVMNLSTFMGDGLQKQKLVQIEMIGQFMKDAGKFQSVYTLRNKNIRPIIHLWKEGKIENALHTLERADLPIVYDCISAILHNSKLKFGLTPDVACVLIRKLLEIMHNKHSTYVKNSMYFLNDIVLMFKDELIKVKMFSPLTRVDLSREQRMAKYDRLTEQFLNVFKDERLKKYSSMSKVNDNQELYNIAQQLHNNLEEVLRKIMPRKEPDPA